MRKERPANHIGAFSLRLKAQIEGRNWSAADLAREASKHVPETHRKRGKQYVIGRHLISSYCRGENEPTPINLKYICKALGVEPTELLPIDVEVETDLAMKILKLVRDNMAGM
jgi:transcriptional regulator with XRE-family HTH domain